MGVIQTLVEGQRRPAGWGVGEALTIADGTPRRMFSGVARNAWRNVAMV